jgi:hypothetical protein
MLSLGLGGERVLKFSELQLNDTRQTNTAEKRLRMHQIMKIWRGI